MHKILDSGVVSVVDC